MCLPGTLDITPGTWPLDSSWLATTSWSVLFLLTDTMRILTKKKLSYAQELVAPLALGFIKTSYFLYFQIFEPARKIRLAIWLGGALTTVFYVLILRSMRTMQHRVLENPLPHTTWTQSTEMERSLPFQWVPSAWSSTSTSSPCLSMVFGSFSSQLKEV